MRAFRRLLFAVLAVAAAVVFFFLLRPGDDADETRTATQTNSTATASVPTATTTTTPGKPVLTRVTIAVRSGRVIGGLRRATFERNERIELYVTSDVSDEIHLHGYDRSRAVAPGRPARLVFRATTPGRFEVELEQRGLQIAEITVGT